MNLGLVWDNWHLFAWGVLRTLELTALAVGLGFAIALPAALTMRRGGWAGRLVSSYVYLFRGTPLIVQTYLIYYGLAQFDFVKDSWAWVILREAWWCALIAFALNSGAYQAEILRGAMATNPKGELEGAKALGLSPRQTTWLILLPSSLRRALPQFGNEVVFMLHGSSVASVITIQDILGVGRTVNAKYYVAYEGFLTAAFLYLTITLALVWLFRRIETRYMRHLFRPTTAKTEATPGLPASGPALRA